MHRSTLVCAGILLLASATLSCQGRHHEDFAQHGQLSQEHHRPMVADVQSPATTQQPPNGNGGTGGTIDGGNPSNMVDDGEEGHIFLFRRRRDDVSNHETNKEITHGSKSQIAFEVDLEAKGEANVHKSGKKDKSRTAMDHRYGAENEKTVQGKNMGGGLIAEAGNTAIGKLDNHAGEVVKSGKEKKDKTGIHLWDGSSKSTKWSTDDSKVGEHDSHVVKADRKAFVGHGAAKSEDSSVVGKTFIKHKNVVNKEGGAIGGGLTAVAGGKYNKKAGEVVESGKENKDKKEIHSGLGSSKSTKWSTDGSKEGEHDSHVVKADRKAFVGHGAAKSEDSSVVGKTFIKHKNVVNKEGGAIGGGLTAVAGGKYNKKAGEVVESGKENKDKKEIHSGLGSSKSTKWSTDGSKEGEHDSHVVKADRKAFVGHGAAKSEDSSVVGKTFIKHKNVVNKEGGAIGGGLTAVAGGKYNKKAGEVVESGKENKDKKEIHSGLGSSKSTKWSTDGSKEGEHDSHVVKADRKAFVGHGAAKSEDSSVVGKTFIKHKNVVKKEGGAIGGGLTAVAGGKYNKKAGEVVESGKENKDKKEIHSGLGSSKSTKWSTDGSKEGEHDSHVVKADRKAFVGHGAAKSEDSSVVGKTFIKHKYGVKKEGGAMGGGLTAVAGNTARGEVHKKAVVGGFVASEGTKSNTNGGKLNDKQNASWKLGV